MSGHPRVVVVDYDMGNRRSVEKALIRVGARASVSRDPRELRRAEAVVLPGVGAFPAGMASLRRYGLDTVLGDLVAAGTPLLGICLGMQLLFDRSSELGHTTAGLGLIGGEVRALAAAGLRVPHIGWNDVSLERPSRLTAGLPAAGAPFYHVHSFIAVPGDEHDIIGTAEYGERFAAIVARGCVYGTQFHPEKSSRHGLALLAAFVSLAGDRSPIAAAA